MNKSENKALAVEVNKTDLSVWVRDYRSPTV